jgi:hypothetical protein
MVHFTIHKTGPTCTATAEGLTTSPKPFSQGELRPSPKKAPCLTAAKSKGTPQPSWISKQGHQIYNSFSLLKPKYSLLSILSDAYKKWGFNTNQALSRSTTAEATAAAPIASRLAAVRGVAGWRAHPPQMQLAKHARSQSTARAAQAAAAMTLAENLL